MPDLLAIRFRKPAFLIIILLVVFQFGGLDSWAQSSNNASNPTGSPNAPAAAIQGKTAGPIITDKTIKNETIKQAVHNLKIHAKNAAADVRVHPQTIDITILGPPFEPNGGNSLENGIFVYIDVKGLSPGIYARPARIILPHEYVLTGASPEVFVVEIKPADDSKP